MQSVSHDQDLMNHLKQRLGRHFFRKSYADDVDDVDDYVEEYDAQGRLIRFSFPAKGLTEFPAELCHCTFLEWLNLQGNQLRTLPAELGQLVNLQTLFLSSNGFTSWPIELNQLASLEELSLAMNQLTSVSCE